MRSTLLLLLSLHVVVASVTGTKCMVYCAAVWLTCGMWVRRIDSF